ncbi:hypothetical protein T01_5433 [Trichinella spiralis]|uniref:Uncharacterized protein n=1 Tax=Trichinella spiralis TaxID=6334 RepID=A0A0V1AIA7_TRISP|nr:hypothetical protein T01_6524 [Trichinella spiralis]KRY24575.1 hypothetical protein T01_5433 [Trichinella spiralis]
MSVTGILQSQNRTPKCLSLFKSCTRLMAVTFPSFLK